MHVYFCLTLRLLVWAHIIPFTSVPAPHSVFSLSPHQYIFHPSVLFHRSTRDSASSFLAIMDASKASYAVLDECDTSTISTITNSNNPDKLWAVKELLAESEDRQLVLVLWQGYPLKEATWEPKENVIEELLTSWEEERSQNGHGRQSKLKIGAWKKAVVESLLIEVPLNLRNYKRARERRGRR
ncbi:hypothetical protein BGZ61DRAFT_172147 [Ilyonectria robusta]|uniref:uncharacterized protein n=1 Tax=Ilyonectria robusta TaxID=1079257 RepID=UPI001E8CB177|nr:uncharacterized protein BGZ61DRAFT_172147 [Ilyonectria robusta]KAH8659409.1 hypothetical protein BGZ61DRAFT_172147 [Ilyonectria robusta]